MENAVSKDVPCAYCDTSVVGRTFVLCEACEVPVHADCWQEGGKCPTYACGCVKAVDPALALFRGARAAAPVAITPAPAPAAVAVAATSPAPSDGAELGRAIVEGAKEIAGTFRDVVHGAAQAVGVELFKPAAPPVPAQPGERDAVEAELDALRTRRWMRRMVVVAAAMLFPMVMKLVSRQLFFPYWIVAIAIWSWPGWSPRDGKRREKMLKSRLAELDRMALPGR